MGAPPRARETGIAERQRTAIQSRRYELDWLRVAVVLGLIPYHIAVIFALGPGDYIKSVDRSAGFDFAATALAFLGMPLLFMISGAATWYAMLRRGPSAYVLERARRLAIPLLFGVVTIMPIQLYVFRHTQPGYRVSFFQFYGSYVQDWAHITWHLAFSRGLQFWGHLWFLLYLLSVSVILLPLLLWLRDEPRQHFTSRIATVAKYPFGLILLGAPLAIVEVVLRGPIGPIPTLDYISLYSDAAGPVLYAVAFVLGFMLGPDTTFRTAVVTYRARMLALSILLFIIHELVLGAFGLPVAHGGLAIAGVRLLRGFITWLLIVAALGYATSYFSAGKRYLKYLNEASIPVYVLHMPILTVLGFYVVGLEAPLIVRYAILVTLTTALTFAVYEGGVRRIPWMRALFGLKPALPSAQELVAGGQGMEKAAHH